MKNYLLVIVLCWLKVEIDDFFYAFSCFFEISQYKISIENPKSWFLYVINIRAFFKVAMTDLNIMLRIKINLSCQAAVSLIFNGFRPAQGKKVAT